MDFVFGIALITAGGLLEGIFSLGLLRTPNWKWEHTWGLGSLFALLLIPWPVALLTVPDLFDVYSQVPTSAIVAAALFGLGWGIGGIFLGLGVSAVGLALGISLIMGLISVFGSAGPLLIQNPGAFLQTSGLILTAGLVIMITGVIVCAIAGKRKSDDLSEKQESTDRTSVKSRKIFIVGLLICILSGILSPLVNYAFIFGEEIKNAAVALGASESSAVNSIWAIVFTVNYLCNFLYCIFLMIRNRSTGIFIEKSEPKYWGWALFLGITWPLGIVLYGIGASMLGDFGAYAGFPMMLICSILGSNLVGALIGEWKGTSSSTRRVMVIGVSILIAAAVLFGYANSQIGVE